jgi:hypothetical protein
MPLSESPGRVDALYKFGKLLYNKKDSESYAVQIKSYLYDTGRSRV